MHLRPHHLLCIQLFTGRGYDAAFTAHMTEIVSALRRNPMTPVCIESAADDLCAACPRCIGGRCDAAEKTAALDRAVAAQCALTEHSVQPWQTLAASARNEILQSSAFHRICADCQWYQLCAYTEEWHGTNTLTETYQNT